MTEAALLIVALGGVVGLLMGLTGAGGGILAVPLLVFALDLSVRDAAPVALLSVGVAAAMGALVGLRAGVVRYKAALLMAGTGVLGAPLGMWLAHTLDTRVLSILFSAVLLWIAYKSFQASKPIDQKIASARAVACNRNPNHGRFIWTRPCTISLSAAGAAAGVLSGLLGVGGGFVMVPSLQKHTDLAMRSIVATSLSVIALISLAGVLTSATSGHFNYTVGIPFSGGAILGMMVGARLASIMPPAHLRMMFAVLATVVAMGMIGRALVQ